MASIPNKSNPESSGLQLDVDEPTPNKPNPESSGLQLNVDVSIPNKSNPESSVRRLTVDESFIFPLLSYHCQSIFFNATLPMGQ